jgi:two-component system, cell cycle sensor histidine kinase and response regulator CckA
MDSTKKQTEAERHGSGTILLVEDDPPCRLLVTHALENLGYQVIEATSSQATLKHWPELRHEVSLVLTDIYLRDSANGNELVKQLKAVEPELKVVYMSGFSPEALLKLGLVLQEGVNFLQKPFDAIKLASVVRANLKGTTPAD